MKIDISISNYYFEFLDLILPVWKLLIEPKNALFENGQFRQNGGIKCLSDNEILQNEITGIKTRISTNIGGKLSFIPSFLFPEHLHCRFIYFHCYLYKYYNYSWTLCISYWDLIKFHYFLDSTERGIGGGREGDCTDNFIVILSLILDLIF